MGELIGILSVIATGSVKLLAAALVSVGLGFGFWETFLFSSIGGCIGVFIFYRLSDWFIHRALLRRRRLSLPDRKGNARVAPKVFTRRNRWLIRLKHSSGLRGLAALTPLVLTIPVGSIIAARFFRHDRRTLPALFSSVVIQSMVVSAICSVAYGAAGQLVQ
jgi:uncharacterized membrane protein